MGLRYFSQISDNDQHLGGKAYGLARLSQKGFPVPEGLVISDCIEKNDWAEILTWWDKIGCPPLAVRSSGGSEDSANFSFAGQNQSFLNVSSATGLKNAIDKCFASSDRSASKAYRAHFLGGFENATTPKHTKMNVVLQKMIRPKFSGVFFSQDPRQSSQDWILEVIPGYGENLVSGKMTPGQASQNGKQSNLPKEFSEADLTEIVNIGLQVAKSEGYPLDMEWCMDENRNFFVLQSRPITTLNNKKNKIIQNEILRLEQMHPDGASLDGQTFSEWSGFPSLFSLSIWQNAFSPKMAFGNALSKFGYQSFKNSPLSDKFSLLESVFGRAYLNLDKLSDLYYGPIPYKIEPHPRPHTKFDWKKISTKVILHTPSAIIQMVRVAWNLSVKRSTWLEECRNELKKVRELKTSTTADLHRLSTFQVKNDLLQMCQVFSHDNLYWPLVLVVLTESTIQRLQMLLTSVVGSEESGKLLRDWMGAGLHTVTSNMRDDYQMAASNPDLRTAFLYKYGHRCPGEMDLIHPRWNEMKDQTFGKAISSKKIFSTKTLNIEEEISKMQTFKREVILEEWNFLKQMLELREDWKMEILKPYAKIRMALLELDSRWNLNNDIHWLSIEEVSNLSPNLTNYEKEQIQSLIQQRKNQLSAFKEYHFPPLVSIDDIKNAIDGKPNFESKKIFDGEALSSGIVRGHVRVVADITKIDLSTWPDDVILVAEATDPGWTPLFIKSKAVVIQNGGVLSHCAIVAREMGIPAVSGIMACHEIFKDGDILWVDGNKGKVYYDSMA